MADHVTLLGAEDVTRAARNMQFAAEEMQRAAASIDSSMDRLMQITDEHARRIEAAVAGPEPRRVIVSARVQEPGNRNWITREKGPATFLRWGSTFEEFENGAVEQSVAIVQFPDGTIDTVVPDLIRFEIPASQKVGA